MVGRKSRRADGLLFRKRSDRSGFEPRSSGRALRHRFHESDVGLTRVLDRGAAPELRLKSGAISLVQIPVNRRAEMVAPMIRSLRPGAFRCVPGLDARSENLLHGALARSTATIQTSSSKLSREEKRHTSLTMAGRSCSRGSAANRFKLDKRAGLPNSLPSGDSTS
jgi:hypothetical protein